MRHISLIRHTIHIKHKHLLLGGNSHKFYLFLFHMGSFQSMKEALVSEPCLAYFKLGAPTVVISDASPVGLGAVLLQTQSDGQNKPIAYASCSLTPAERRYSQIEREALGCVWAVEHFRTYLWGVKFTLQTDHKPLIYMLNPEKATLSPPRKQRLGLRLQPYDLKIEHCREVQRSGLTFTTSFTRDRE